MKAKRQGHFIFRSSAALFFLSAAFELLSIKDEVLLFAGIRSGAVAVTYHLLYIAPYELLGIGLWARKPWGGRAVIAATAFYTLDQGLLLLSPAALESYMLRGLGDYANTLLVVGPQTLQQVTTVMVLLFVASWWGFAWYTYAQRAYFRPDGE